jgi:hypothetical protein
MAARSNMGRGMCEQVGASLQAIRPKDPLADAEHRLQAGSYHGRSSAAPHAELRLPSTGKKQVRRAWLEALWLQGCAVSRGKLDTALSWVLVRACLAAWCRQAVPPDRDALPVQSFGTQTAGAAPARRPAHRLPDQRRWRRPASSRRPPTITWAMPAPAAPRARALRQPGIAPQPKEKRPAPAPPKNPATSSNH